MILARQYLDAARVPKSVKPQSFGLWTIERRVVDAVNAALGDMGLSYEEVGWLDYTLLRRVTPASLHLPFGEIVMEDSRRELRKHLPIWMAAHGRVLKTGLGLGRAAGASRPLCPRRHPAAAWHQERGGRGQ